MIIDLYFLIPAVITQVFIVSAELTTSKTIPTKEAKSEIGTRPATAEVRVIKFSV